MAIAPTTTVLKSIPVPPHDCTLAPVPLTDATIAERKAKVLAQMAELGLDSLVVYADLEHGNNFEYLVGFLPRFEEALLVLHADGSAFLLLGNENLNKAGKARIQATAVHVPFFSLANQPMEGEKDLAQVMREAGLEGKRVGLAGWKLFTSRLADNSRLFDAPAYVVDAIESVTASLVNATEVFIGPRGVRRTNNANEIAHYEFGSSLAGDAMLDALDALAEGVREVEVADRMQRLGQRPCVVTIAAFGPRFVGANMYPTTHQLAVGEPVSLTIGYKGGLSSRAGYAVERASQLPDGAENYLDDLAIPYFNAIRAWLMGIHVGMAGGDLYRLVDEVLPRERFHWGLCPGHLTADEEWLCSPVYAGSAEPIESGMIFQTDVIPSVAGYAGVSMESTCAIADETLRQGIAAEYPDLWGRFESRRAYIADVQGIELPVEVLPMCSSLLYLKPYLLGDAALCCE